MPSGRKSKGGSKPKQRGDLFGDLACDLLYFEKNARLSGFRFVAGLDEAGRGPLAGPVVAAAVILPESPIIEGLIDSKQVPEPERERLFDVIREQAVSFGIGIVDECTIDSMNILQASLLAMEQALTAMKQAPDYLLLDAVSLPGVKLPQKPLIKGDCRSASIAAASILAKVTRDRLMLDLHARFPQYNFHKHKGYCTKEHLALLREHGPCAAHRKSFAPVAEMFSDGSR